MSIPIKNKRIWFLMLLVVFVAIILAVFISQKRKASPQNKVTLNTNHQTSSEVINLEGDVLGIGSKQRIEITNGEFKSEIKVFNKNQLSASASFDDGLIRPSTMVSIIKIDQNDSREYIRWDQVAGPHQFETFILTTKDNIIRPVITADYDNDGWYRPFWSTRDNTIISDADGDSKAEILEFVDEYPSNAPRLNDPEIEKITRDTFPDEIEDDMWQIVSRENNGVGRGRKVLWNIYTIKNMDPLIYQKVSKPEYQVLSSKLFKALKSINGKGDESQQIISRYDLTQDSVEFNYFVRNFWTQGRPYIY